MFASNGGEQEPKEAEDGASDSTFPIQSTRNQVVGLCGSVYARPSQQMTQKLVLVAMRI